MPRGFNDREKAYLRAALLEKGRTLFATHGLRKTNVEDLARAAGMSKGAFYLFYESKEALFFAILQQFEQEYRAQVLGTLRAADEPPRAYLQRMLRDALHHWREHALLLDFSREAYELLLQRLPENERIAHLESDTLFSAEMLAAWAAQGIPVSADARQLTGLMRALFFVNLHAADFEPGLYEPTIDLLLDAVVGYVLKAE